MGANSSVVNDVTNNTYNISDTAVKVLNQNINSAISNSMVKSAQNCSSSIFNTQSIDFSHIVVYGNFDIDNSSQIAKDSVTFDCLNSNDITNSSNNAIISELMGQMSLKFSNAALSEIAQAAAAKAAAGGIPGLSQSANANVSNVIFNNVHNEVNTNITMEQIVKNTVEQNFNAETVSNCIATTNTNQSFTVQDSEFHGNVTIHGFTQDAATESLTSCIQKNNITNKATSELLTNLGFKINDENNNFGSYASNQKGGTETETSGPLAGLWGTLQSLFGNFSESIIVVVVLSCICCMFILWLIFRGGSSDSDTKSSKSKSSKSKSSSKSSDLDTLDDDDINDAFANADAIDDS